ncbi:MAG: hypothetical protein ACLP7P_12915 [Rhodomicrobium sp.]
MSLLACFGVLFTRAAMSMLDTLLASFGGALRLVLDVPGTLLAAFALARVA